MATILEKIAKIVDRLDVELMTLVVAGHVKRGLDKEGIKLTNDEFLSLHEQVKKIVITSKYDI